MNVLLLFLGILGLLGVVVVYQQVDRLRRESRDRLEDAADQLSDQMSYQLGQQAQQTQHILRETQEIRRDLYEELTAIRESLHRQVADLRTMTDQRLLSLQESNEKRLDDMRRTVDEKLEKTLQSRLQVSFETVSKQLESVNRGLGEMQQVARDVGSLNKVLSNTKTRGILGEILLGQIVEDILTPSQYEREFPTVPGSSERVEYAVKMPGQKQGESVYLPIDSKFPLEDYYRLEEAYEAGDKAGVEAMRKSLLASVKRFAKDVQKKYIQPPATTNFAIIFLPTEGLYAEVVRQPAFLEELRKNEQVLVSGPSTLSALLNSLSVGFRTLNIQQSADDISKVLGNVKVEFQKFGGLLQKTQKQLHLASNNLDVLMTTRSNAIERALRTIESYEDAQPQQLGTYPTEMEDHDEN